MKYSPTALPWVAAGIFGLAIGVAQPASAVTALSLDMNADSNIQQSSNNPCVISSTNCSMPAYFDVGAGLVDGGYNGIDTNDWQYPGSVSGAVSAWSVWTIGSLQAVLDAVGANAFSIGLDLSQSQAAGGDQFLHLFQVVGFSGTLPDMVTAADGTTEYQYVDATGTNVGDGHNPGNGWADYLLSEITMAALAGYEHVGFFSVMSNINDGPDQFFIVPGEVTPIPVPAALPLFLTGLLGFGFLARRRRQMAEA